MKAVCSQKGWKVDQERLKEERAILKQIARKFTNFEKKRQGLIPILQMVQEELSYLSPEALNMVAGYLEISKSEIYGVATFYNQFRFQPPGKHPIKVCLGTACHVRAGDIILENFERKLKICDGETSDDREFSLERVACVGCCALAPVAVIGETVHGHMAPSKVEGLILRIEIEKEMQAREKQKNESGQS
jgi:NADH-quinone oxidoreductase subunit E